MENGTKNKFKRSILTLKITIFKIGPVFLYFLTNGSTVWARERLILQEIDRATNSTSSNEQQLDKSIAVGQKSSNIRS